MLIIHAGGGGGGYIYYFPKCFIHSILEINDIMQVVHVLHAHRTKLYEKNALVRRTYKARQPLS